MKPEQIARAGTEHAHQTALMCWCNLNLEKYPELKWIHSIPNGGDRDKIVAGKLKAEGVKAGVWDLFLPVDNTLYNGIYIEMKKPGREQDMLGGLSQKQKDFGMFVHEQGYSTFVCYHWEQARDVLVEYLDMRKTLSKHL